MGLAHSLANRLRRLTRKDSWSSDLLGFGGENDKLADGTFSVSSRLPVSYLDQLVAQDPLCARVVGAVVHHGLRQGWYFDSEHSRVKDLQDWLEETYDFTLLVELLAITGRAYGGAAIFPMAEDPGPDLLAPLQADKISNVWNLQLLDRDEMYLYDYEEDYKSRDYRRPKTIRLNQKSLPRQNFGMQLGTLVHSSRLIQWCNRSTTETERRNDGWCESVLMAPYESIRAYNLAIKALGIQVVDANQSVYKIKALDEALTNKDSEARLQARFDLLESARSAARAIVLDAEFEDWQRVPTQMTHLPESLITIMQHVSMASGIPLTVLFGMSPAGLNATGDADIRNWYDTVKAFQENQLKCRMKALIEICRMDAESPLRDASFDYDLCFPSLWQLSPQEKAATKLQVAQTDQIYLSSMVYEPEDVAVTRAKKDGWMYDPDLDTDTLEESKGLLFSAPEEQEKTQPTPGGERPVNNSVDPQDNVQQQALNGAQVTAVVDVVKSVVAGEIPKETAKQILLMSFPVTPRQADALLNPIEEGSQPELNKPVLGLSGQNGKFETDPSEEKEVETPAPPPFAIK